MNDRCVVCDAVVDVELAVCCNCGASLPSEDAGARTPPRMVGVVSAGFAIGVGLLALWFVSWVPAVFDPGNELHGCIEAPRFYDAYDAIVVGVCLLCLLRAVSFARRGRIRLGTLIGVPAFVLLVPATWCTFGILLNQPSYCS